MQHECIRPGRRMKLAAGLLVLLLMALAHAGGSAALVGGGSTLAATAYAGTGAASHQQLFPAGAGSLFAMFSAQRGHPPVSYCQNGSGTGKSVLALVPGTNVQNDCLNADMHDGFGASNPGVGRGDVMQPNFVASDAPLNQQDLADYTTHHAVGALPVQFPAVAGAIAIVMNKTDDRGIQLNNQNTNFSDAQLCLIFSGQVTDWGDPRLVSAYRLPSGDSISGPITLHYPSDRSGTTFGFSNHLARVCSGMPYQHFVTDEWLPNVVGQYLPVLPPNWIGASTDDPGVVQAVLNAPGSMGYAALADVLALDTNNFARVNGYDPRVDFGNMPFAIDNSHLIYNAVMSGADGTTGEPVLAAISPLPATPCIATVDPAFYANPSNAYPIMAVSYLLANAQGNGLDVRNVRALLDAPYDPAIRDSPNLTRIGPGTGVEMLNLGALITSPQIHACLVN